MAQPTHLVFMNFDATGHINPTLPVVAELVARGCKVTYFVDEVMREVVEANGAEWRPFRTERGGRTGLLYGLDEAGMRELVPEGVSSEETGKLLGVATYDAREVLPGLLEDLRALSPQPAAIVHDIFVAAAEVAAQVLRIPSVGFVPHPGPGVCAGMSDAVERLEAKPWVDGPRRDILARYGVDPLEKGAALEFYSPSLNVVTTVEDFFAPPATEFQKRRIGHCPFRCVGSVADPKVKRVANANVRSSEAKLEAAELPLRELDEALAEGKQLVFVSLGTVATGSVLWPKKLGHYAGGNDDGREEGARCLSDFTGKEFCQYVWRAVFEALGDREDLLVVMSLGGEPDALEGLPPAPRNFVLRKAVPQLEVLRRCGAFLTHGGANSMHEALSFGVPMAVVPIFGDQPINADSVARVGAGASFRHPLRTLTAEALRESVLGMLEADSAPRAGARAMREKLAAAGGAPAACKAILDLVAQSHGRCGGA